MKRHRVTPVLCVLRPIGYGGKTIEQMLQNVTACLQARPKVSRLGGLKWS